MPIDYRIDQEHRIVFATPRGTLTPEDLLEFMRAVWTRSDLKSFDELVDLNEVERVEYGSPWRVREMTSHAAALDVTGLVTRLAIVAHSDHHFGLGRMYQSFREANAKSTREVQVFRSREAALAWIEERRLSSRSGPEEKRPSP